jgi:serine/arginine repetitive matrix protein 1
VCVDDICCELCISLLEAKTDPKEIQIQMTGFLEESTFKFMKQLWELLLSAQSSVGGIPQSFLEAKKEEIKKQRVSLYSCERLILAVFVV